MAQKLLQGVFHIFCYLFPRLKETKGKQRIWSTGSNLFPDLVLLQFHLNDYFEKPPWLALFVIDSLRFGLKFISALNYGEK